MTRTTHYVLDTNMVAYIVSGRSMAARKRLRLERERSAVALSAVTQAEILFGLERKPEATRLRAAVADFFNAVPVMAWDSNAAQAYGPLRARLSAAGKGLSAMDLLIASHAIALNAVLVTHDKGLLQVSSFLKVIDWASDL
jgi:tRNA(fMet)-specific endonuclease VapC